MSITLKHAGLPNGIGRFALIDTFDAVARSVFDISATAIRLLKYHVGKCRDSDFLAGRICGTWEQPQQTAVALGISTRVLNNAERELIDKGFVNRTATPHSRRDGRRSGDNIAYAAGINLAPLVERYPELAALQSAEGLKVEAKRQLRLEIADIRGQIRISEDAGLIEQAEGIIPRGRTSRINEIGRLEAIKMDLEALLACLGLPSGEQKTSDRTEENFSPNILPKDTSKNCSGGRRQNGTSKVTPETAARLASEDYQALLEANGGPSWQNLIETSSMACNWLGISQKVWGEACQKMGRKQSALYVLVIDRNWRLPAEHRYRGRRPQACLKGIVGKGGDNLNVMGFLRAISFATRDGETHQIPHGDSMLERLDLAYAINVHVAQGMTAKDGIIMMSAHEKQLNSTAGFLVAVTRIAENATLVVDNAQQVERDVAHNPGGKTSAIEATQNAPTPESRNLGSGQDQTQIEPPTPPEIEKSRDFDMGM